MAQQVSSHEATHTEACDEYNVFILLHVSHHTSVQYAVESAVDVDGYGTIGITIGDGGVIE